MENENQESQKELDNIYEKNAEQNINTLCFLRILIIIIMVIFAVIIIIKIGNIYDDLNELKDLDSSYPVVDSIVDSTITLLKGQLRFNYLILAGGLFFGITLICIINSIIKNILLLDVIMKKINYNNKEESKENNKENSKQ